MSAGVPYVGRSPPDRRDARVEGPAETPRVSLIGSGDPPTLGRSRRSRGADRLLAASSTTPDATIRPGHLDARAGTGVVILAPCSPQTARSRSSAPKPSVRRLPVMRLVAVPRPLSAVEADVAREPLALRTTVLARPPSTSPSTAPSGPASGGRRRWQRHRPQCWSQTASCPGDRRRRTGRRRRRRRARASRPSRTGRVPTPRRQQSMLADPWDGILRARSRSATTGSATEFSAQPSAPDEAGTAPARSSSTPTGLAGRRRRKPPRRRHGPRRRRPGRPWVVARGTRRRTRTVRRPRMEAGRARRSVRNSTWPESSRNARDPRGSRGASVSSRLATRTGRTQIVVRWCIAQLPRSSAARRSDRLAADAVRRRGRRAAPEPPSSDRDVADPTASRADASLSCSPRDRCSTTRGECHVARDRRSKRSGGA